MANVNTANSSNEDTVHQSWAHLPTFGTWVFELVIFFVLLSKLTKEQFAHPFIGAATAGTFAAVISLGLMQAGGGLLGRQRALAVWPAMLFRYGSQYSRGR